jgi:hypothetical protein
VRPKTFHSAANQRRACGAAHENDFVDFSGLEFASASASFTGAMVRSTTGRISASSVPRAQFLHENFSTGSGKS